MNPSPSMQHSRPSIPWQIKRLILSPLSSAFLSSVRPMIFTDALKAHKLGEGGATAESFLLFPFQARVLRPDCAISIGYEASLYFYFASFHDASKNAPNGLVVLFKLSHSPRVPAFLTSSSALFVATSHAHSHIQPQSPV